MNANKRNTNIPVISKCHAPQWRGTAREVRGRQSLAQILRSPAKAGTSDGLSGVCRG